MEFRKYPFTYWYRYDDTEIVEVPSLCEVPDNEEILFGNVYTLFDHFNHLGACGINPHIPNNPKNPFLRTTEFYLEILPLAIEKYGEIYPIIYRGIRSDRPDSDYRILFGSLDRDVAAWYGTIRKYRNIKGLHFQSSLKNVLTDDWEHEGDSEVIFLPPSIESPINP
jgi:hypothetical protein